jgi:plastocyanin
MRTVHTRKTTMRKTTIALFLTLAALAVAGTSYGDANVTISGPYSFTDNTSGSSTTTINAGETVTWHWSDSDHSATSGTCTSGGGPYGDSTCTPDNVFDSGIRNSGASFSHTFPNAGTFPYYCQHHLIMMTGTVKVNSAVPTCGTITLSPTTLPGGLKDSSYSQTITASGGTAPYSFAVTTGNTPPGINLGANGDLTGQPTGHGSFPFSVTATDASSAHCTGTQAFSILVADDSPAGDAVVIPGVGSLPGSGGALFRTQLQLTNPTVQTIAGKIVFHTGDVSGTSGDPSLAYTLASWQTINFDDILPAMGLSGLGSADLVPTSGPVPASNARIYNDAGAAGTSSFSEPAFRAEEASQAGDSSVLILPSDATNYRFNLGVRSLSAGVSATFTVWDASGSLVATVPKTFGPNLFHLDSGPGFLGLPSFPNGGSLGVTITQGSAVFFGATVDNRTQDTSTQFTRHN